MCRIAGLYDPVQEQGLVNSLHHMQETLAHGGPDDAGIYVDPSIPFGMAHRRLSIIDLSAAGHQPMHHPALPLVIVYNGEIYNYRALRALLEKAGERFTTVTDTEVLLKGYARMGPAFLHQLRGMFAFAIWDEAQKCLFLARDRFGIKPLYYGQLQQKFCFASELKVLRALDVSPQLSLLAASAFLQSGSVPAPLTIYEGMQALPPGHYLEVDFSEGKPAYSQPVCWWNFMDLQKATVGLFAAPRRRYVSRPRRQGSYDAEARTQIRRSLLHTIEAHLVADVEVGAFLSGGIDSTAIVSLMRQLGCSQIHTFSMVFPGHPLDESAYARQVARLYGTHHQEQAVTLQDLVGDWQHILQAMDQPTIDGVNTYFVSKLARAAGLKVVLSGLGGDELFGGYPSFRWVPSLQRWQSWPWFPPLLRFVSRRWPDDRRRRIQAYLQDRHRPAAAFRLIRGLFTAAELQAMGMPEIYAYPQDGECDCMLEIFTPLQYVSCLESRQYMCNQLLRDSDVFSMAHGLELRVPFVDHELYAAVWPYLDSGYSAVYPKRLLVEAVGDLPSYVVQRPKQGFTFPLGQWIRQDPLKTYIEEGLHRLEQEWDMQLDHVSLQKSHWSRTWALFVLSQFV